MSEYEHLKKQKDEMIERHKSPGSKCPMKGKIDFEKALADDASGLAFGGLKKKHAGARLMKSERRHLWNKRDKWRREKCWCGTTHVRAL